MQSNRDWHETLAMWAFFLGAAFMAGSVGIAVWEHVVKGCP